MSNAKACAIVNTAQKILVRRYIFHREGALIICEDIECSSSIVKHLFFSLKQLIIHWESMIKKTSIWGVPVILGQNLHFRYDVLSWKKEEMSSVYISFQDALLLP